MGAPDHQQKVNSDTPTPGLQACKYEALCQRLHHVLSSHVLTVSAQLVPDRLVTPQHEGRLFKPVKVGCKLQKF
jgi:hypothetical protein